MKSYNHNLIRVDIPANNPPVDVHNPKYYDDGLI